MSKASELLADPLGAVDRKPSEPDFTEITPKKLLLDGRGLEVRVEQSLTSAGLERTIEGASALTLALHDPGPRHRLLESGIFSTAVLLELLNLGFVLAGTSKSEDTLTLTFEDRQVAWLRRYSTPKRFLREAITRAAFFYWMAREPKEGRIRFVSPELHKRQEIAGNAQPSSSVSRRSERSRDEEREGGFSRNPNVKIKGAKASSQQLRDLDISLSQGRRLRANRLAMLAMLCSGIGESSFTRVINSLGYGGVFQGQVNTGGRYFTKNDTEKQAYHFFKGGKGFQAGGAIHLAKTSPSMSPGTIATKVEASGQPGSFYDVYLSEAKAILEAWGGPGSSDSSEVTTTRTTTRVKRYAFTRGYQGKKENSWECMGRLADEVGWRRFMVAGALYFISEQDLFNSRPRMQISESSKGVDWIDFELDRNGKVNEATVKGHIGTFDAPPGSVVILENSGPADGRWLVSSINQPDLFSSSAELTLRQPIAEKAEPAPETETTTSEKVSRGPRRSKRDDSGSMRDKVIRIAKSSMTSVTGFSRYSQAGALTGQLNPRSARTDCSQWTRAVYLAAGGPDIGTYTVPQAARGKRTGNPKPGDLMFTSSLGHVELYIGNGRTIGHGSAPIDYGSPSYFGSVFYVTYPFLDG